MQTTELSPGLVVQNLPAARKLTDFKLIAFDMDSTLINIECVDEIADAAGRKAEVAAITEAAMRGEIANYKESLRQRVALLKGVTVAHLEEVYTRRLQLNPGAEALVHACKAAGLKVLLVSGGFTFFTDRIRERLGIDFARSNVLEVESDANCGTSHSPGRPENGCTPLGGQAQPGLGAILTGRMVDQPWGDICDGAEKRRTLLEVASLMGIPMAQTVAMGDGANDLPMMGVAGLSVAYHAKPAVREQAMVCINTGGLDRLLEVVNA
jgi:phosphoserine phosphatase